MTADDLRVAVQIIEAVSGRYLWSQMFDGRISDVFGPVAQALAAARGGGAPLAVSR